KGNRRHANLMEHVSTALIPHSKGQTMHINSASGSVVGIKRSDALGGMWNELTCRPAHRDRCRADWLPLGMGARPRSSCKRMQDARRLLRRRRNIQVLTGRAKGNQMNTHDMIELPPLPTTGGIEEAMKLGPDFIGRLMQSYAR